MRISPVKQVWSNGKLVGLAIQYDSATDTPPDAFEVAIVDIFNEHVQLEAELKKAKEENKRLNKLLFAYESVKAPVNPLVAELAKYRWIPLQDMPQTLDRRIELLTHKGWVDCGYKDAYGKGFNLGTGEVYMPAKYYTHYRLVILPEGD